MARPAGGALLVAGTLLTATPAGAQRHAWQPGDRLLIGELGNLGAVAVSPRNVFAASAAGIVVYDLLREEWAPPLPLTDDFPLGVQPTALAYDRVTDGLWLGSASGELFGYTLGFERWDRIGQLSIGPIAFLAAAPDGIYAAARDGWHLLGRGSFLPRPVSEAEVPPHVRSAAAESVASDPALAAARGTLGLDASLRRWPLTDAVPGDRPGEFWIATGGGGLVRYDSRRGAAEWLPIGLPGRGAGAIAAADQRIWFAGDGRNRDGGVAAATSDLTQWWRFPAADGAPGGRVVHITPVGSVVWFAADDGLYRLDPSSMDRQGRRAWTRITTADGLPADRVTSIAAASDGVWATTTRGVAFVRTDGSVARFTMAPGRQVGRALLAADTLWVATEAGLFVAADAAAPTAARDPVLVEAPGANALPALRTPVYDVAIAGGVVYALTSSGLYRRDAAGWIGPERAALDRVGRPLRLAAGDDTVWVAGERGVAAIDATTGNTIDYLVPADIPAGPVLDVAPTDGAVWLATPAGALRLRIRDQ